MALPRWLPILPYARPTPTRRSWPLRSTWRCGAERSHSFNSTLAVTPEPLGAQASVSPYWRRLPARCRRVENEEPSNDEWVSASCLSMSEECRRATLASGAVSFTVCRWWERRTRLISRTIAISAVVEAAYTGGGAAAGMGSVSWSGVRIGGTGSPCPNGMGSPLVGDVAASPTEGGTLSTLQDRPRGRRVKACKAAGVDVREVRWAAMRILCLGEALVDLVCERPVASISEAGAFVPHFGGAVANVAVTAARRGADVALAGGVGTDPWGVWLHQRLEAEGVDLRWFDRRDDVATPVAFVTVDAEAQPRFAIYGDGLATAVTGLGDRVLEAVDACDALFFSSNTLVGEEERAVTLAARDRARAAGKPVIVDPNLRLERWRSRSAAVEVVGPCVEGALLVKCNGDEALALTGELEVEAAAASLLAAGAQHVVITLGGDGALLRGGGLDRTVRAVPATPVDTTGAGDAVTGVLLAALGRTGFYPAALAAKLPEAMAEAARATERYGAVEDLAPGARLPGASSPGVRSRGPAERRP